MANESEIINVKRLELKRVKSYLPGELKALRLRLRVLADDHSIMNLTDIVLGAFGDLSLHVAHTIDLLGVEREDERPVFIFTTKTNIFTRFMLTFTSR